MAPWRSRAFLLSLALLVSAEAGAQTPNFGAPSGNKFRKAMEDHAQRDDLLGAHREAFPVFVFIPGIMGSKLFKTEGGKKRPIFGHFDAANPNDGSVIYDETEAEKISADLLNEFVVDYRLGKSTKDIYGTAIKTITNLSTQSGTDVLIFPYDWRQTNVRSAEMLAEWLCSARSRIDGRQVAFVAHSMGGLILKHWLKNFYESHSCKGEASPITQWLKIRRIAFLGTPHYGSPQALFAFSEAYYLLYEPLDAKKASNWQRLKGAAIEAFDRAYFSSAINSYGVTFPSGYQLLPITGSKCFPATQKPPFSIKMELPGGQLDVFNPGHWTALGWPTSMGEKIERGSFTAEKLPRMLKSAEDFLCGLSDYRDIDSKYEVMRFFGDKKDTICNIEITGPEGGQRKVKFEFCPEQGDGTVPKWTAAEAGRVDPKFTRALSESHVSLAGAKEFVDYLRGSFNEFHRRFQERFIARSGSDPRLGDTYKKTLVDVYTNLEVFIPRAFPLRSADNLTGEINRAVARNLEVTADEIYDDAKGKGRAERADGLRVYSDLIEDSDLRTNQAIADIRYSWSMNSVAHSFLQRRDFVRASAFAKQAIEAVDLLSNDPTKRIGVAAVRIKGLAALTAAIAAKELKDEAGRRQYCDMALAAGNQKARQPACRLGLF